MFGLLIVACTAGEPVLPGNCSMVSAPFWFAVEDACVAEAVTGAQVWAMNNGMVIHDVKCVFTEAIQVEPVGEPT